MGGNHGDNNKSIGAMSSSVLVSLDNVTAGYEGRAVVRDVKLDIKPDDVVALIGPNGGGKTTIVRLLLGILKPMSGRVTMTPDLRVGYLPQVNDVDLKFPITVADVVMSGQREGNRLFPTKREWQKVDELLDFAQLSDVKNKSIGELSGGQRQRVFLCRALMSNPQLLVLDEPVTYMDKVAETNLYKMLPELAKKMAIVLVSHDIGTISSVVKTIACVKGTLHYHDTNEISSEMLSVYECPVEILAHGVVPHRVLGEHGNI